MPRAIPWASPRPSAWEQRSIPRPPILPARWSASSPRPKPAPAGVRRSPSTISRCWSGSSLARGRPSRWSWVSYRCTPPVMPSSSTTRCPGSRFPTPCGDACARLESAVCGSASRRRKSSSATFGAATPGPISCLPLDASKSSRKFWTRTSSHLRRAGEAMADLNDVTAAEAARRIRSGALSPSNLLAACLKCIDALEPTLKAWVHLDRDAAARVAVQRDIEAREGRFMGPLHGVPVALKDIYDAAGLVTTAGAGPWAHRRATVDAVSVARLRAAGAVILGKVTTTAFAFRDPTETGNPWNPAHTPGGSSSGSGAVVGSRMAPLALGTQTVGSVLRPAAYCGVVGLKPTHGRISAVGVVPLAWSLDHVGVLCRSVEDAALALAIMAGHDAADPHSVAMPIDDYVGAIASPAAPRLGVLRALVERAEPDNRAQIDSTLKALRAAGAVVEDVPLAASFAGLPEAGDTVLRAEAAAFHGDLYARHAAEYPVHLGQRVRDGQTVKAVDYLAAQAHRRACRADMAAVATRYDALVSPTAPGPAPKGLAFTGDASFCAPWSSAGMPSISLPTGLAPSGLPFAFQLTGASWSAARLFAAAAWCEGAIGFKEAPRA